jgi:phosphotransferase system enzyme I (PtsI)
MNASAVPRVKQAIRGTTIDHCVRFARKVMEQADPVAIRDMVLGAPPS